MEPYTKGSVSALISQSKSPKKKSDASSKSYQTVTCSLTPEKNVRFDCNEPEREHVQYVTTPFSSGQKKGKERMKKTDIVNEKKCQTEKVNVEKMGKKRKFKSVEAEETAKRVVNDDLNDVKKKKKKDHTEIISFISEPKETVPQTLNTSTKAVNQPVTDHTKRQHNIKISPGDDETDHTIFIGNLPLSYNHKKVVKLFSKFGKVKCARIRCVPVASINIPKKTCAITKKFHPNRKSAAAFVVFKEKESVGKAVSENGMLIDGHHLRIDYAVPQKKDLRKSVFVGGLPFDIEDDDLWNTFKDCGEIQDVRVIRDENIFMGKGFGYVNFKTLAAVELALKLNGQEIKNRKINVERCVNKRMKKDFQKSSNFTNPKKMRKKNHKKRHSVSKTEMNNSFSDFQGKKAQRKQKKKKHKLTKDAIHKNKIKSALLSTSGQSRRSNNKENNRREC